MSKFVLAVQIHGRTFVYQSRDFVDMERFGQRYGVFTITTLGGLVLSTHHGRTSLCQEVVRG